MQLEVPAGGRDRNILRGQEIYRSDFAVLLPFCDGTVILGSDIHISSCEFHANPHVVYLEVMNSIFLACFTYFT